MGTAAAVPSGAEFESGDGRIGAEDDAVESDPASEIEYADDAVEPAASVVAGGAPRLKPPATGGGPGTEFLGVWFPFFCSDSEIPPGGGGTGDAAVAAAIRSAKELSPPIVFGLGGSGAAVGGGAGGCSAVFANALSGAP